MAELSAKRQTKRLQYLTTILAALSLGFLASAVHVQSQENSQWSKSVRSLNVFQPGDAVRIQIWELYQDEERTLPLSGDYPINSEGFIILPIIGEVRVKGVTAYELMQTLQEKFTQYLRNPYIYVRPLIRVTMQGAFNKSGVYYADPASSLWNLVALADGPAADADLKRMRVERTGQVVMKDLLHSYEKGYSLEEIGIETGDQIITPGRGGFNFGFMITLVNLFTSLALLYLRLRTGSW